MLLEGFGYPKMKKILSKARFYCSALPPLATGIQTVNGILGLTHFRNRPRGKIAVGSR